MFSTAAKTIKTDRCSLAPETIQMLQMEKNYLKPITEELRKEMNLILGRKQVFFILIFRSRGKSELFMERMKT